MFTGTTPACDNTCGRGAGTHGDVSKLHTEVFGTDTQERGGGKEGEGRGVTVSSANHETAHVELSHASEVHHKKPLALTHLRFENRWRTTRSGVLQSFALPDEAVELHFVLRDNTHQHTHTRTNTYSPTHPPTDPPTTPPLPSLPSPSHTHVHANANAHVHARVFVYVCMCI